MEKWRASRFLPTSSPTSPSRTPPEDPFAAPLHQSGISRRKQCGLAGRTAFGSEVLSRSVGRAGRIHTGCTGGLEVRGPSLLDELSPGTVVEVAGYPGPILDSPLIEDALIGKVETNAAPPAIHLLSDDLFQGGCNNQLVEVEGRFLGRVDTPSNCVALAVQAGSRLFTALLDAPYTQTTIASLEAGCTLRLIGVCRSQMGIGGEAAVSLLMRSPADVEIISPPASTRAPGNGTCGCSHARHRRAGSGGVVHPETTPPD